MVHDVSSLQTVLWDRLKRSSHCAQMVQESMKKELSGSQGSYSILDLFRTTTMRNMTLCLSAVWYIAWSRY